MNLLSRLLALGLFVTLMLLSAVIAVPAARAPSVAAEVSPRQRIALPLAMTALAMSVGLLASLTLRPRRADDAAVKLPLARAEMEALSQLAARSAVQDVALNRERSERQFAEADAHLKQQLLNSSLEEKIRLGRDLHDGIIQSLYAAGLTIESVRAIATTNPAEADRRLEQCRRNLNATIRDVRDYISGLTPETLRQSGFSQALREMFAELGGNSGALFDPIVDEGATTLLTPEQTTEALQIAREAMSNSLRHGGAKRITARLHHGENEVCLLIQDDGKGFNPARQPGGGFGLANMKARAARAGGEVRIESQPGHGTRMLLTLSTSPSRADGAAAS